MGARINTIMQTCFFAISGVLPKDEAIEQIKKAIKKTYGAKGKKLLRKTLKPLTRHLEILYKIEFLNQATSEIELPPIVSDKMLPIM